MKIFLNIFFFIFVSSCSSLAFWKNEEIDPTQGSSSSGNSCGNGGGNGNRDERGPGRRTDRGRGPRGN